MNWLVRPLKILEAANWLVKNSVLSQSEGMTINDDWINANSNVNYSENIPNDTETDCECSVESNCNSSEEWTEQDEAAPKVSGNFDTVITCRFS